LRDLGVYGRIILDFITEKQVVKKWNELNWLGIQSAGGFS
jgi:hypothetical protein